MRRIALVALVITAGACRALPIDDAVSPTPVVSTAPASISLRLGSRTDQRLDVSAQVLTVKGVPVSGVTVTFSVTSGTVTPATSTTDDTGLAHAIASAPAQNTITASAGALSDTQKLLGIPPEPPLPLTVGIPSLGSVRAGDEVQFGVTLSSAYGSTVHVVEWTFGDGGRTNANTFQPRHTYGGDGTYTVTIAVADDLGRTANASQHITVSTPAVVPPMPPTTSLGVSIACTVVTPLRRSCTANPTVNGVAVAPSLVANMVIEWGDASSEGMLPATATPHTYATGTLGNFTVKVYGTLTTGERFIAQTTIAVG